MDMSDPRVIAVLAHAEACEKAYWGFKSKPPLPHELKDLSGIDLSGAKLSHANLNGADLAGADLSGANLTGVWLSAADLSGAKLSHANLNGADLGFADLTDAKITQDQLNRAGYINVVEHGYPKEVAEKVILLHAPEPDQSKRENKKTLVVELRSDGKLYIKTSIFRY
jgi:hypothetical protein